MPKGLGIARLDLPDIARSEMMILGIVNFGVVVPDIVSFEVVAPDIVSFEVLELDIGHSDPEPEKPN